MMWFAGHSARTFYAKIPDFFRNEGARLLFVVSWGWIAVRCRLSGEDACTFVKHLEGHVLS